jgi:hypothetical protein
MVQVVECLPSKDKALSLNPSTKKKKKSCQPIKDLAIHLCLLYTGICQQFTPLFPRNSHLPCILSSNTHNQPSVMPKCVVEAPQSVPIYVCFDTHHVTEDILLSPAEPQTWPRISLEQAEVLGWVEGSEFEQLVGLRLDRRCRQGSCVALDKSF